MSDLRIGTSGYVYPHWRRGSFYPEGLRQRDELAWYASRFQTVELNNPFYRLPEPDTFRRWRDAVPEAFVFAVKASRYITHIRRLRDTAEPLALFLDRASLLGPKLGPILCQLPPTLEADPGTLSRFVGELPTDRRWVIEFRHPSWHTAEVYQVLAAGQVALCIPVGGQVRPDLVTTAPFAYIRMHSGDGPGGGFTREQLRWWAARIRGLSLAGKDCYVYFNNDRGAHAPRDARALLDLLDRATEGKRKRPPRE